MAALRSFVLIPIFDFSPRVLPSTLAVILAAGFGGAKAGLFATAFNTGLLLEFYYSEGGLEDFTIDRQVRMVTFLAVGGLTSWGAGILHAARRRAEERQRELEKEVRERKNAEVSERRQRELLAAEMQRREQAETELREQEERVRQAIEAADLGTWEFNPVTGEQRWSGRAKQMLGLPADSDVTNVSFRDRVHPEDRERVNEAIQKAFDPLGDGVYEVECRVVWPDDSVHWFIARGQVLFEGEKPDRRAVRLIGTAFDITDRKQAEETIRAGESRLQAIMDNASAVIYLKDLQGRFLMINKRFEELLKVTQEQFIGKTDADIFPSDVVAKIHAHDRQVKETGMPLEFEEVVPHKDGPHTYVAVKFPITDAHGAVIAIGGISTDITDRNAAEEIVRNSETRLRAMMDNSSAVIYLKDLQGRYLMVNRRYEELFNATQQQIFGKTDADVFPSHVVEKLQANDRQVRETGQPLEFEEVVPHDDGPHTYVSVKFPVKDANGAVVAIGGMSTDISDRKAAEDLIRDSEARLRGILDNTPAVVSLKDRQGRYVLVNRGWEQLYGVSNDEIAGLTNEELLSASRSPHMSRSIADKFLEIDQEVVRTGKVIEIEDPAPYGDDPTIFVTVKFPIKDARGNVTGIGGISIDVTERRKAANLLAAEQEMLRHTVEFQDQERQLVSSEIHDGLVQYVTGALMQLEGVRHQLESETDAAKIQPVVEILRMAVAEGRRLINGIRTPVLDDWGVVAAIEQLIREAERPDLPIQFIKDPGLGRMAPRLEETLYRVTQESLTNINKHSQSGKAQITLERRGDRIHLEIRDWGIGFTPSKKIGGTHGLSGIGNRARIAGGQCTIESAPGEGTKIAVDLPYLRRECSRM